MKTKVVIHDAGRGSWLHFHSPVQTITAQRLEDVLPALARVEELTQTQGLHAAGFITYEASPTFDESFQVRSSAGLPLLWFGIYEKADPVDMPASVPRDSYCDLAWEPSVTPEEYSAAMGRIQDHLHEGLTYQVNYTFRMSSPFVGDPWSFFVQLCNAQQAQYACYIDTEKFSVCSVSPELFFMLDGQEISSLPMKGTAPRGLLLEDDLEQAKDLHGSEKNRAENLMITDMVRNDLGRIAIHGSVKVPSLFTIEKYPTLWQMTSKVTARTTSGITEIMGALFPPASITGAPKTSTMQIISELESTPRGLYTGCIGFIGPERKAQFNVAIRTVVIEKEKHEALYAVGGGIVWDSVESKEFEECRTKALVLTRRIPEFSLLESMLWKADDGYFLLEDHLDRLMSSAAYFDFRFDQDSIMHKLDGIKPCPEVQACKVRLALGKDGRITTDALPFPAEWVSGPVRVGLAKKPVDDTDVFLYHKTTRRRLYDDALQECPGCDDVLLFNTRGEITESCMANVVFENEEGLFTPPVTCGLLGGVYRSWLIRNGRVRERVLRREDLRNCLTIYLVNSVRKMRRAILEY